MPIARFQMEDGRIARFEVPDGTTPEQAHTLMQQHFSPQQTAQAPAPQASGLDNFLGGLKKAGTDTALGVKQLGAMAGMGDKAALEKEAADVKARDAAMMDTGAGMAGNVIGNIGMSLLPGGVLKAASKVLPMIPGLASAGTALLAPKTLGGAAALGAATGVVQPATSNEDRVTNAVIGGIGGSAGNLAARGISRVLNPQTDDAVKALMSQGVTPTPGQIVGGAAKRAEDAATSIPLLGDAIRARQKAVIGQFNDAAINRSLAPIGQSVTSTGREAIDEASKKIGAAYDAVLPKVVMKKDQTFANAILAAKQSVGSLPAEQQGQFMKILKDQLEDKFTPQGFLRGHAFKEVDSELGRLARGYMGDPSFSNRQMGQALRDAQAGLRNLMAAQNPQYAKELGAANEAWANFIRVQDAAGRVGAKDGIFTPAQLGSAVRGQDKSLRHGAYAKGEALMQDLSDSGQKVLNQTVPDSGTPYRAALGIATGGGLAAVNPAALAATAGASALYTQPAQKVIAALLTQRPDIARRLGYAFQRGAPFGAIPGAAIANSQE
jgi:hypothetical protein